MAKNATHHVTHRTRSLEADLYIADSLLDKLESPHPGVRSRAEDSLAIAFREECSTRYGADIPFIGRGMLSYDELPPQEEPVRMGPGGVVLDDQDDFDE